MTDQAPNTAQLEAAQKEKDDAQVAQDLLNEQKVKDDLAAKEKVESDQKAKEAQAQADQKAKDDLAAKERADAEQKARDDLAAKEKADAEQKAREEQEAKEKAEQQARVEAEAKEAELAALTLEVAKKKEDIASKKAVLLEKTSDLEVQSVDAEQVKKDLKEAQEKSSEANREYQIWVKEKADIQPAYERALANWDLKDRADTCRKEVAFAEKQLEVNNALGKSLNAEMQDLSQKYKEERQQKAQFVQILMTLMEQLEAAVEEKIQLSLHIDEEPNSPIPNDLMSVSKSLVWEREREIRSTISVERETRCIRKMKLDTEAELEKEAAEALMKRRRERDEGIKEMIFLFQGERNELQNDIEEVRKVNEEQSINLKRGHVVLDSSKKRPSASNPYTIQKLRQPTKIATEKKDTPELAALKEQNTEVGTELQKLKESITAQVQTKANLLRDAKSLKLKAKAEQENYDAQINQLQSVILSQVQSTKQLEKENSRLTEAVQHLVSIVRTTKEHVKKIRGSSVGQLPVEQD